MKKIFLVAIVGLAFVSCKKDYTCECTTTRVADGATTVTVSEVEILEVSKKTVNNSSECISYETKNTFDGEVDTRKVVCEITKN